MKLIVGLGNPGEKYEKTPHNAGFMAMDKLRHSLGNTAGYNVSEWEYDKYGQCLISQGKSDNKIKFVLAKPLTFMNKSGLSVQYLVKKFKIDVEQDFVLYYDDLDIKLGELKISKGKFPKGHNGLENIFLMIKKNNFLSVRIGIDNRDGLNISGEQYVLKKYSDEELEILDKSILESIRKLRVNISI